MLNNLWYFFISSNSQSISTIIVGLFAFIIYRFEKVDKEKTSAYIILEELRSIERTIDRLREVGDLTSVTPSALSTQGWVQHRNLVVKYLDFDQAMEVGLYYQRIDSLRETIIQWRSSYFKSLEAKSQGIQNKLIELASSEKSRQKYEAEKENITSIIHADTYFFEPSVIRSKISTVLPLIIPISSGLIGEKIKSITEKNWFQTVLR